MPSPITMDRSSFLALTTVLNLTLWGCGKAVNKAWKALGNTVGMNTFFAQSHIQQRTNPHILQQLNLSFSTAHKRLCASVKLNFSSLSTAPTITTIYIN